MDLPEGTLLRWPEEGAGAAPDGERPPRRLSDVPPQRAGIVDLGSNSVRLVVFEGRERNPLPIFNEKAVLGLGRGLAQTGRLNAAAVDPALTVLGRYHAVARAMRADPLEVVATAAVREASNGPEFIAALNARMPGVPVRVLSGKEEAETAAAGVLLGMPAADGVLADLGGGSVELVRVRGGAVRAATSLPLGVLRLADRAGGEVVRARRIVADDLGAVPWLDAEPGRDLILVGGAWRALARMHMARTGYPLAVVHHYALAPEAARSFTAEVMATPPRLLERWPEAPGKRVPDLPFAAAVLRRLLKATGARRAVFSANGVREGWYAGLLPSAVRAADPMLEAARAIAALCGRDLTLPPALLGWMEPLFDGSLFAAPLGAEEDAAARRRREAACWLSDIGSRDHPEYRAEHAFFRALRQSGTGLDHADRAFLALCVGLRYEAEPDSPLLAQARMLLDPAATRRAEALGAALRLAYTLCGGAAALLRATAVAREDGRLVLRLRGGAGVFAGESIQRRAQALAAALGLGGAVVEGG